MLLHCLNLRLQVLLGDFVICVWIEFSIRCNQEIIKVREWIPHIGPLTKVIPHKLFLNVVPGSSAESNRALRRCFREEFVYMHVVSFRLVSF